MKGNNRIEELLLDSGAFTEKNPPVLGTSGIPLFYFINTERLLNDQGKWESFADDSRGMIAHSINLYKSSVFKEVVVELAELAAQLLNDNPIDAISGFQRRDWPFSGPLAYHLKIPHVSIYKNQKIELIKFDSDKTQTVEPVENILNKKLLHVSDLLTLGSSAVKGWLPIFSKNNVTCRGLLNVVSRKQSGEETLTKHGIQSRSLVYIDETFLRKYSVNSELNTDYFNNPEMAIKNYLQKNGADCFVPFFQPENNPKLSRAISFYHQYAVKYLSEAQLKSLSEMINRQFGRSLNDIIQ